jgi:hypothetical protein
MTVRLTVKMTKQAKRHLKIIAALTGEKQYEVLDRLLAIESKAVIKKGA